MSMRLAIFDCDGTLSDGQAAVCMAMERAFAQCHRPAPERHAVRRIVGLSLPQAVEQLAPDAPDELRRQLVENYKQAFRQMRLDGALDEPLFEGIETLLRALHEDGWRLGVATGKSDRGLRLTLAAHGIGGLFTTLQTADRHPSKPHPSMLLAAMDDAMAEPGDTIMIGDTVFDIEMALTAGARALGVGWGYHEADELLAAGAEAVAAHPQDLGPLLRGER